MCWEFFMNKEKDFQKIWEKHSNISWNLLKKEILKAFIALVNILRKVILTLNIISMVFMLIEMLKSEEEYNIMKKLLLKVI